MGLPKFFQEKRDLFRLFLEQVGFLAWKERAAAHPLFRAAVALLPARYPLPGRLIEVGGCKLHIQAMGEGQPAVVFESGSGGCSLDWQEIAGELAQDTRVILYDRAAHGWSQPSHLPRTLANMAEELHALLHNAGQKPPFILVGHSLGGLYGHYYARFYPDEVAGLVLVDAPHPDLFSHYYADFFRRADRAIRLRERAASLGLMRLGILRPRPVDGSRNAKAAAALAGRPAYWRAVRDQNRQLSRGIARAFEWAGPFPPIPLVVVAALRAEWTASIHPDLPRAWTESQEKLARLSPKGRLARVANSGHEMLREQPQAVVAAVREMLARVRDDQHFPPD